MRIAITRDIADSINGCELTHLERTPIDVDLARAQHERYRGALRENGWEVVSLPALEDRPDSVFVEDAAVVLPECAIITRLGAESRRDETASIRDALRRHREVFEIHDPATIDGGDVIVLGRRVWIGETSRTNGQGINQFRAIVAPLGYEVTPVRPHGCLHLKSAASAIGERHIALNPRWIDAKVFAGCDRIETPEEEPRAANLLDLGDRIAIDAASHKMRQRVERAGFSCISIDSSELAKAEGALTCCSLLVS